MTSENQYRSLVRRTRILRGGKRAVEISMFAAWRLAVRTRVDTTHYDAVIPEASYAPWKSDREFKTVLAEIRDHTVVDIYRLWELWTLVGQLKSVEGDILEVGVWRGGSGVLMGRRNQLDGAPARVFLCDTFTGVVKAGDHDTSYEGGEFADTSPELVRELAARLHVDKVEVHQGIYPDDAPESLTRRPIKLCHIDVDTFGSAQAVTDWVWNQLVPGGIVVYDDYGFFDTPGVTEAVNAHIGRPDRRVFHNLNGHALIVKVG